MKAIFLFIFGKNAHLHTHLCVHTLTHKNIPEKGSSGIKICYFNHQASTLKIRHSLIVKMFSFLSIQLLLTVDILITHFLLKMNWYGLVNHKRISPRVINLIKSSTHISKQFTHYRSQCTVFYLPENIRKP